MQNVYLDPNSYVYLQNVLFAKDGRYNTNNCRTPYIFLKDYCASQGINLQTIDFWPASSKDDIYVSFDHKFFLRKQYWKRRNPHYPIVDSKKFAKRILFQFEPPVVMPEIRYLVKPILNIYDTAFFTWKIDDRRAKYFHTPQAHEGIFSNYWQRDNRLFLTLIQSNRKALFRYKELLTERIRALLFFAQTNDIDLYGFGWEDSPLFPYASKKNEIQKIYKSSVKDKYDTLSHYTFAFAYENCELPGYITDKIFDCFYAGTIPIYWGAEDIAEYIPKNCFIHMRDFKDYKELREFLKSLKSEQIEEYKHKGRGFIESEQYKQFTKEHFAKVFTEAIKQNI